MFVLKDLDRAVGIDYLDQSLSEVWEELCGAARGTIPRVRRVAKKNSARARRLHSITRL